MRLLSSDTVISPRENLLFNRGDSRVDTLDGYYPPGRDLLNSARHKRGVPRADTVSYIYVKIFPLPGAPRLLMCLYPTV